MNMRDVILTFVCSITAVTPCGVTPTAILPATSPRTLSTPAIIDARTAAVGREPRASSRDTALKLELRNPWVHEACLDDLLHPLASRNAHLLPYDQPKRHF